MAPSTKNGSPGRRRMLLVGAGVLAVGAAGLFEASAYAAKTVPRGTTVGGVPVGGLTRDQAVEALRSALPAAGRPLTLRAGSRTATLDPAAAGLALNPAASVDAVTGSPLDLGRLWAHLVGGGAAPAVPEPDRAKLTAALHTAAAALDVAAVDGGITFDPSGPRAIAPVTGTAVDVDAAVRLVARSWLGALGPITVPITERRPAVDQAAVDRALADATRAVSGPLTLRVGGATVTVAVQALRPALRMSPTAGRLELAVDGAALRTAVLGIDPKLETVPTDAKIVLLNGAPSIEPSVDGSTLDPSALGDAVRTALLSAERTASVTTSPTTAKLTTEAARALGVSEKVSTFSTNLTSNVPRTNNLRLAAKTVNGTLVLPGETFSLNAVLGQRTPEKGYSQAPVINGGRLELDYGGGVSQMATTIYNNVFFAGLKDIRHMPHSFYISRYPEGREATVSYPTVDLVWRNDSPYGVLVQADVTTTVNVSFWSTKVYDVVAEKDARTNARQPTTVYDPKPTCVPQGANAGFDVVVRRKLYKDGALVRTESWKTSYIAEDQVICGPKPSTVNGSPD